MNLYRVHAELLIIRTLVGFIVINQLAEKAKHSLGNPEKKILGKK